MSEYYQKFLDFKSNFNPKDQDLSIDINNESNSDHYKCTEQDILGYYLISVYENEDNDSIDDGSSNRYYDLKFNVIRNFPLPVLSELVQGLVKENYYYSPFQQHYYLEIEIIKYTFHIYRNRNNKVYQSSEYEKIFQTLEEIKTKLEAIMIFKTREECYEYISSLEIREKTKSKYYYWQLYAYYVLLFDDYQEKLFKLTDLMRLEDAQDMILWGVYQIEDAFELYETVVKLYHRTHHNNSFDMFGGGTGAYGQTVRIIERLEEYNYNIFNDERIKDIIEDDYTYYLIQKGRKEDRSLYVHLKEFIQKYSELWNINVEDKEYKYKSLQSIINFLDVPIALVESFFKKFYIEQIHVDYIKNCKTFSAKEKLYDDEFTLGAYLHINILGSYSHGLRRTNEWFTFNNDKWEDKLHFYIIIDSIKSGWFVHYREFIKNDYNVRYHNKDDMFKTLYQYVAYDSEGNNITQDSHEHRKKFITKKFQPLPFIERINYMKKREHWYAFLVLYENSENIIDNVLNNFDIQDKRFLEWGKERFNYYQNKK